MIEIVKSFNTIEVSHRLQLGLQYSSDLFLDVNLIDLFCYVQTSDIEIFKTNQHQYAT